MDEASIGRVEALVPFLPTREALHSFELLFSDSHTIMGDVRCISHRITSGLSVGSQTVSMGASGGGGIK